MEKLIVGYVGLSKASWKTPKIQGLMDQAVASLEKLPVEVVRQDELTISDNEVIKQCDQFNAKQVDVVIIHFPTFPLGAMIPEIASRTNVPILLFANPEKPAEGGIWEQNSFCGANMAAHVMHRMKKKYRMIWGKSEELGGLVKSYCNVLACAKSIRNTKVGLIGGRVPGFYTSNFNELRLRTELGSAVEIIDLVEIVETARKITGELAIAGLAKVKESAAETCCVSDEELAKAGKLYQAFIQVKEKYNLDDLAIRCWPEFPDYYDIAPCAVIGMLNNDGIVSSCEGDVYGALTMAMQKHLSGGGAPFFVDLISFDYGDNTGVVWHCGAAPKCLCRDSSETVLRKHMRVDGGDKKGLTNDFSLKSGRITLAKLDETDEGYRMLIATGTALDTDKFIRGNPLRIKFDDDMKNLIDTIIKEGFEHHYSVIHADMKNELLALCELCGIKPITVG